MSLRLGWAERFVVGAAVLSAGLASSAMAEGGHHGVESVIAVPDNGAVIRGVWLDLDADHGFPSDLTITLRHDHEGIPAVTADAINRPHDAEALGGVVDLTEAFEGRAAGGEWTLAVSDGGFGHAGEVSGWTLRVDRCTDGLCTDELFENHETLVVPDLHFDFRSTQFWGAVVNFVLLVFLLVHFGRKPIKSFLVGRRRRVEEELVAARQLREEAQRKQDEYTTRLAKLDRELEEIRSSMVKAGEEERDRIVAGAEKKAARLRRDAQFMVEQQLKQLRVDLTREAAEAAVDAAERVLRETITPDDQVRLAHGYLDQLKAAASPRKSS